MELSYSTDPAWCAKCKHLPCICKKASGSTKTGGVIKMRREMRRGKPMIVLFELAMKEEQLKEILKNLQKACATGGAIKDGNLEIQGDHRERIEQIMSERGFKVKRAGG